MEFSPYDIGMPKYGTFMKPELFGCKFFMGQIVKRFPEPPLHFLQGEPIGFLFLTRYIPARWAYRLSVPDPLLSCKLMLQNNGNV